MDRRCRVQLPCYTAVSNPKEGPLSAPPPAHDPIESFVCHVINYNIHLYVRMLVTVAGVFSHHLTNILPDSGKESRTKRVRLDGAFGASANIFIKKHNGRMYAFKDFMNSDTAIREIEMLTRVATVHPNVMSADLVVWEVGPGGHVLIGFLTELCQSDLAAYMYDPQRLGGEDTSLIKKIGFQIASGLTHIHSHGVVHCDLHMNNIFVSLGGNRFIIGDFNCARKLRKGGRILLPSSP